MRVEARAVDPSAGVLRRVARSSAWYVAGFGLASGASFAISIVVGRALGPADFGRFSYHVWLMRLLATILTLGIPAALTRTIAQGLGAADERMVGGVAAIGRRALLVLAPVAGLASAMLAWWRDGSTLLAFLVGAGTAIALSGVFLDGVLGGFRAFRALASVALWSGLVGVALVVGGALGGAGWRAFVGLQVGATAAGVAIMAVAAGRRLREHPRPRALDRDLARRVGRFAVTMAAIGLLTEFVLGRPELFFLDRWWPESDLGLYSAALRLSTLVVILPGLAARVLVSEFSWTAGAGDREGFRASFAEVCRYAAVVGIGLGLLTASVADHLIGLLFGAAFASAGGAAAVLLLGGLITGITAPVGAAVLTGERHGVVARLTAIAAVINLALDLTLIPAFGVMGAAVATMVALATSAILVVSWARRRESLVYPVGLAARLVAVGLAAAGLTRLLAGPGFLRLTIALAAGSVVYLVGARATGALDARDVLALRRLSARAGAAKERA